MVSIPLVDGVMEEVEEEAEAEVEVEEEEEAEVEVEEEAEVEVEEEVEGGMGMGMRRRALLLLVPATRRCKSTDSRWQTTCAWPCACTFALNFWREITLRVCADCSNTHPLRTCRCFCTKRWNSREFRIRLGRL